MDERAPLAVIGAVAVALADQQGADPEALVSPMLRDQAAGDVPADAELSVDLMGVLHEQGQGSAERQRKGSHYTPPDVADRLVAVVRADRPGGTEDRLGDPTVGGGAFLLAGARALAAEGVSRGEIVRERLWGADLDPVAVEVCRTALALWAGEPVPADRIVVADTLVSPAPWVVDLDVVVGNPPFLSPLAQATAPDADRRQRLRARFGDAYGPYVDAAALFLLVGLDLLGPGGRMGLVQPLSFLAARDAGAVRTELLKRATLRDLWVAQDRVFGAAVEVCAPVVEVAAPPSLVTLRRRRALEPVGRIDQPAPDELAPAAASMLGVPVVDLGPSPLIGDQATVTAGFRDEYYGIAAAVTEGGPGPLIVTAGRVGPLRLDPRRRPVRIQRQDYTDPRIDLVVLRADHPSVADWVDRLLVPKVLVATQTPIIEVVADPAGQLVPLTPVIVVVPPPELVWSIAALLTAPSLSAMAAGRTLGLGRHSRVIKVSARDLRGLPGLVDAAKWRAAGEHAQRAQTAETVGDWRDGLLAAATSAEQALGASDPAITEWWSGRAGLANPGAGLHRTR